MSVVTKTTTQINTLLDKVDNLSDTNVQVFKHPEVKPNAADYGIGIAMEIDVLGNKSLYGSDGITWGLLRHIGVAIVNSFSFTDTWLLGDNLIVEWDVSDSVNIEVYRDARTGLGYVLQGSSTDAVGTFDLGVINSSYYYNLFKIRCIDSNGFYIDSSIIIYESSGELANYGPENELPLYGPENERCVYPAIITPPDTLNWKSISNATEIQRYGFSDAINIAENLMTLQRSHGGWSEAALDSSSSVVNFTLSESAKAAKKAYELNEESIYDKVDNTPFSHHCAGVKEASQRAIRFLLRSAEITQRQDMILACNNGLAWLLSAQHSSGGWPHTYPSVAPYGGNLIVNNDGASADIMYLLRDIVENPSVYTIIPEFRREQCAIALDKLIQFFIDTQYVVSATKTGWPGYVDRNTLQPAGGRAYEFTSIDGASTRQTLTALMNLPTPSDAVKAAVVAGVAWINTVKDVNHIATTEATPQYANGFWICFKENPANPNYTRRKYTTSLTWRHKLVAGTNPSGLWYRMYSLDGITPMFGDYTLQDPTQNDYPTDQFSPVYVNDGLPVIGSNQNTWSYQHGYTSLDDICIERNRGYLWIYSQQSVLDKYTSWSATHL